MSNFLFRIRNNNLTLLNTIIGPQIISGDLHDKIKSSMDLRDGDYFVFVDHDGRVCYRCKVVTDPHIVTCKTTDHNGES